MRRIVSKTDSSVNFVLPKSLECRYVRRSPHYVSAYVSSHNGCKMACKFCWLTASKQTKFDHVSINQYVEQMNIVLKHAKEIDRESSQNVRVNINLMARGEALANKHIVNDYPTFYQQMESVVKEYNYAQTKINISTIMPTVIHNRSLVDIFRDNPVNLYYSLYSTNDKFRKKWLPNAMPWQLALNKLHDFQTKTNNIITFHFAIIDGENDDLAEIKEMANTIKDMKFGTTKYNLVRFNPHPSMQERYREPPIEKIEKIYDLLQSACNDANITTNKSRIVPRIGYDVYASCGMFVEDYNL